MAGFASRILSKASAPRWAMSTKASSSLILPRGKIPAVAACQTNSGGHFRIVPVPAKPQIRHLSDDDNNRGLPPGLMSSADTKFDPKIHTKASDVETVHSEPPEKLDFDMVDLILTAVEVFLQKGVHRQRLDMLAGDKSKTVVEKWQKMMEIFFTTQLQVVVNFGYSTNEHGLQHYNHHLREYLATLNDEKPEDRHLLLRFKDTRRDTWRNLVATTFEIDINKMPELNIAEARSHMHRVSEKMLSGEILLQVQKKVSRIQNHDEAVQNVMRHTALQEIIVEQVYKPLLPELGFVVEDDEDGGKAYASFQCAMADFEGDVLMGEYANAAMRKLWEVAGLDINEALSPGAQPSRTP